MDPQVNEVNRLKFINQRLRRALKDHLGPGVWGLDKDGRKPLSHEEVLFLFARVYPALGFDHIRLVRTEFPDCIAVRQNREVGIELERNLSEFEVHLKKDDLAKCQYVVCWENDLEPDSWQWEEIKKHCVEVIELKQYYWEGQIKGRTSRLPWTTDDIRKLTQNQLRILKAFISANTEKLSLEELKSITGIQNGKQLGAMIRNLGKKRRRDYLVRYTPEGSFKRKEAGKVTKYYQINHDCLDIVRSVVMDIRID